MTFIILNVCMLIAVSTFLITSEPEDAGVLAGKITGRVVGSGDIVNIDNVNSDIAEVKSVSCEDKYKECNEECASGLMNAICKDKCSRSYIECR
jgi:hypothetical protein